MTYTVDSDEDESQSGCSVGLRGGGEGASVEGEDECEGEHGGEIVCGVSRIVDIDGRGSGVD